MTTSQGWHALRRWTLTLASGALAALAFAGPAEAGIYGFEWNPCPQDTDVRCNAFGCFCAQTSSVFVRLAGRVPVAGVNGLPADIVFLTGVMHVTTEVAVGEDGIDANIFVNLDQVSGISETTGLEYRGVGASAVSVVQPESAILSDQTFTFRLMQFGAGSASIKPELPVDLTGFTFDDSGKLLSVSASFGLQCTTDICP